MGERHQNNSILLLSSELDSTVVPSRQNFRGDLPQTTQRYDVTLQRYNDTSQESWIFVFLSQINTTNYFEVSNTHSRTTCLNRSSSNGSSIYILHRTIQTTRTAIVRIQHPVLYHFLFFIVVLRITYYICATKVNIVIPKILSSHGRKQQQQTTTTTTTTSTSTDKKRRQQPFRKEGESGMPWWHGPEWPAANPRRIRDEDRKQQESKTTTKTN